MASKKRTSVSRRAQKAKGTKSKHTGLKNIRPGPVGYDEVLNRRRRILEIAGDEFLTHGFHGTNIDIIATRSQVSKVTIYRECGNKESLFQEFFLSSISGFRYDLNKVLHSDRPLIDVVRDIVRLQLASNSDVRVFSLMTMAISERKRFPHVARRMLDQAYEISRILGDYLKYKLENAEFTREEAARRAFHLMNMALGGAGVLLDDPKTFYGDHDTWIESVAHTFVDGLPKKTATASLGDSPPATEKR